MVDAMLKEELRLLRNDLKLLRKFISGLNGQISRLSEEVDGLKGAIRMLVDRMEKNNVLKRLEGKGV